MNIFVAVHEVKSGYTRGRVVSSQAVVDIKVDVDSGYDTKKLQLFRERLEDFINENIADALKEES